MQFNFPRRFYFLMLLAINYLPNYITLMAWVEILDLKFVTIILTKTIYPAEEYQSDKTQS